MAVSSTNFLWQRSWCLNKAIDRDKLDGFSKSKLTRESAKELLSVAFLNLEESDYLEAGPLNKDEEETLIDLIIEDPIQTLSLFPKSLMKVRSD